MSTALVIPTSGVARRRAKAVQRRRRVHTSENDRAVAAGGLPVHWIALDTFPCGRVAWLKEGATAQEREAFDQDAADHTATCDGGL